MGAVTYYLGQLAALVFVAILAVAVIWEANHLIDWTITLYNAHGDGSLVSYLRFHAYTYMDWLFGDVFGWTLES